MIFCGIHCLYGKNLFDIFELTVGKYIGKICTLKNYKTIVMPTTMITVVLTSMQSYSVMTHWEWGANIWFYITTPLY